MEKTVKIFIWKILTSTAIFSILLLPFQIMYINGITVLRPISFFPIVIGIFWGTPAAIGIFLGHIVCGAVCTQLDIMMVFTALISALSAVLVKYLFYLPVGHPITKGQYIYDIWSLLKFIVAALIAESVLAAAVSAVITVHTDSSFLQMFENLLCNNIHSVYILGIPVMLFLPLLNKWADEPDSTVKKEDALFGYYSANSVTFRKVMLISLLFAALICSVFLIIYRNGRNSVAASIDELLLYLTCIDVLFLLFSAFIINLVQRELVEPLRNLASKLTVEGETYSNEFDIISRSMDFVVSGSADLLSGAEYSIIIGLTTKDNTKRFLLSEARGIINKICLNYVKGYISSVDGEGGYRGETAEGNEQILIYTIFGATDKQIQEISDEILDSLSQESVLIEKNRNLRYYYYGKKKISIS